MESCTPEESASCLAKYSKRVTSCSTYKGLTQVEKKMADEETCCTLSWFSSSDAIETHVVCMRCRYQACSSESAASKTSHPNRFQTAFNIAMITGLEYSSWLVIYGQTGSQLAKQTDGPTASQPVTYGQKAAQQTDR